MVRPTMPVDRTILDGEHLTDGSIRSPKIGTSAVGATHIASGAIIGPKLGTSSVGVTQLRSGGVIGPKLGTSSVGLTQAATVIQRNVTVVSLGASVSAAQNFMVFRSPPSGVTISAAYLGIGGKWNATAGINGDNWVFSLKNAKTGSALNKNACSLSNQTLAATAFKTIPVNNGNSTVLSGHQLRLECSVTGGPVSLNCPVLVLEWVPKNNA